MNYLYATQLLNIKKNISTDLLDIKIEDNVIRNISEISIKPIEDFHEITLKFYTTDEGLKGLYDNN